MALGPVLSGHVSAYLKGEGIHIRHERASGIEKARDGKIIAVLTDQGEKIGCDFALVATGTKPNIDLAKRSGLKIGRAGGIVIDDEGKTSKLGIWACGDCTERKEKILGVSVRAPLSLNAFRSGRVAGKNAARGGKGRAASLPGLVHAAALGLGSLEMAHTGWTLEAAQKLGIDASSVHTTHRTASSLSVHHPIHVGLVAELNSGRILGAQIVGGPGSAARINVITAIIRSGGNVDDLYNLDFVYAPTLAPAHDPLFVTARLLQKKLN